MTVVWVLDVVGYDARGGNAEVFSSEAAAKAARPHVKEWVDSGWLGHLTIDENREGMSDTYEISPVIVDNPNPTREDWPADLVARAEAAEAERERRNAIAREEWKAKHPLRATPSGGLARS